MQRLKVENLTASEALAAASGVDIERPEEPAANVPRRPKAPREVREVREVEQRKLVAGNYRLYRHQWEYLQQRAHELHLETHQRIDVSAILRDLVDRGLGTL